MLVGNNLRLRAVERTDLPLFVQWLNDPEVTRNLLLYLPLSLAQEEDWFESLAKRPMEERPLAIEIHEAGSWRMIGNLSFHKLDWRNRHAEVGIFIGDKTCWNKGYGRQAMRLMVRHAFHNLNLNRVWLQVYATNTRGIRAYEAAGFIHEGRLRQAVVQDGEPIDVLIMSVLRSEWNENLE
jgi:RimJ/RimL family protein N-acetyltransferase